MYSSSGYSTATGQPGQGYLSATGSSWTDATQVETKMSICIKAFTTNVPLVGAPVAGAPAVTAQNANSLDLFVRGTDNALWYKYLDGHDLDGGDVSRRSSDVVTRSHITG